MKRVVTGVGAVFALIALVAGVPALLVAAVGNPWPGRAAIELRDERLIVVGLLAALAWLGWARFTVAVVIEVPRQWRELVGERRRAAARPAEIRPPARSSPGIGMLAARLVATALVLVPVMVKPGPVLAGSAPLPAGRGPVATTLLAPIRAPSAPRPVPVAVATGSARSVQVGPGDTLIGIAREQLGDAARWREIFELNRDRPQPGGQRLTSPSALELGWRLLLPGPGSPDDGTDSAAEPAVPEPEYAPAATVVVQPGDTLWELTHERLVGAGWTHDDGAVLDQLDDVVAANADVLADPNLIYLGQEIDLPPLGTPPAPLPPPTSAPLPAPGEVAGPPGRRADPPDEVAATTAAPATSTSTTTTTTVAAPPDGPVDGDVAAEPEGRAPAPIGLGEAALLSTGALALIAARRRRRLRAARPRARLPEPAAEHVAIERTLRAVDAGERLLRLDVAVRAAAAALLDVRAQPAVMRVGPDGTIELILTGDAALPAPWRSRSGRWFLPASVPAELIADEARRVGAPCVALTQLGTDDEGHEVFVDLEALGVLGIVAADGEADAVVRALAATLATTTFAESAHLIGVGLDDGAFFEHQAAHHCASVDQALELAATLIGTTASARHSTFVLRARHTSGEAWEPAVVVVAATAAHELTDAVVTGLARRRAGVALVMAGRVPDSPWQLRLDDDRWTLLPVGIELAPVALTAAEADALHDVLQEAELPLVVDEPDDAAPTSARDDRSAEPPWSLLVRLLGPVGIVDRDGADVDVGRAKALELVAWLALHRERSTRTGARTALWDLDVRDSTFANVVSEARRALARAVPPPEGQEWIERTLTERLPLHELVVSDADLVRARLHRARVEPPQQAIDTLRPAVELIRDHPFAGTGYLWPDPEGIASNLVLLATSAATELAGHYLSMGDVDGVFWATGQGLKVLPGHEELIALRMRAHHRAGDLAGVRLEWESYERVLDADSWSGGEPAPKLVQLRRELLSPAQA